MSKAASCKSKEFDLFSFQEDSPNKTAKKSPGDDQEVSTSCGFTASLLLTSNIQSAAVRHKVTGFVECELSGDC